MAKQKTTETREEVDPLEVDLYNLDREWQEQPVRMRDVCLAAAAARKDHSYAKDDLEFVENELRRRVRSRPEEFGLTKVTEGSVEETVKTQQEYRDASREVIEAKYRLDVAESAVQGWQHRKSALENAVILYCRDYFSDPRLPREHQDAAREKMRDVTSRGRWDGHRGTAGDAYDDR